MRRSILLLLIVLSAARLQAADPAPAPTDKDAPGAADPAIILSDEEFKEEFPLWARDLRRAEIVAFGSLPFTLFLSRIGVDTWRWASNDWTSPYAPWPLKGSDAIDMTTGEARMALGLAFAGSACIALADHLILRSRRSKEVAAAERRRRSTLDIEVVAPPGQETAPTDEPPPEAPGDSDAAP